MDPQDLLFTNNFVSKKTINLDDIRTNSKNYNEFISNKNKHNNNTRNYILNDQLSTQKINKVINKNNPWPVYNDNKSPVLSSTMEDVSRNNYSKKYITSVSIDSRNRNLNTDILPNNYTISLSKDFENVEKIEVKGVNINNTIPPINNNNNNFTWTYPKQGETLEFINSNPFFRNKFVRGQMPEYLFSRNDDFINSSTKSVSIPEGFYSVFNLKDTLVNKLNETIFIFGDPGVSTVITDYIDPDSRDKISMNYK